MEEQFSRTANLIGQEKQEQLFDKKIIVIGLGGVGGFVVEALARAGVSNFLLIDGDVVSVSNLNRQIIALNSTIDMPKTEAMKRRVLDINKNAKVETKQIFLTKENVKEIDFVNYDYVVDAIDNITAKIEIACLADSLGFKLISCMGTGNKLHPELFEISDIYKTSVCPVAKIMRKKLKERNVRALKVLYSEEQPKNISGERVPASISFCPSIAGLRIAQEVIFDLLEIK